MVFTDDQDKAVFDDEDEEEEVVEAQTADVVAEADIYVVLIKKIEQ